MSTRAIGLSNPVADRLRGWLEFASKLLRITSGANQLDHLAPEFRRIWQTGLGHGDTLGSKLQGVHEGGAIPGRVWFLVFRFSRWTSLAGPKRPFSCHRSRL